MTLPNAPIDGFRFAQPILQHGAGRRSNSRTRGHRRTIYNTLNQYHVVMEVAPEYWQNSETLNNVFVSTSGGAASGTQTTNALAGTAPQRVSAMDAARADPPRPPWVRTLDVPQPPLPLPLRPRLDFGLRVRRHAYPADPACSGVHFRSVPRFASGFFPTRPHGASDCRLTTAAPACSCLRLAVATNKPREGLSPPIQCPCQAHLPARRANSNTLTS